MLNHPNLNTTKENLAWFDKILFTQNFIFSNEFASFARFSHRVFNHPHLYKKVYGLARLPKIRLRDAKHK